MKEEEKRNPDAHDLTAWEDQSGFEVKGFKKSQEIAEKVKHQWIREIFDAIDDDGDGQISSHKIDITQLENEMIDILTPALLKIENNRLTLDLEGFTNLVEDLLPSLNVREKNIIVGPRRQSRSPKREQGPNPIISDKSEHLAWKKWSCREEEFTTYLTKEGKRWEENWAICHEMV